MGRYSSDSDSSDYYKKKKSRKNRSSSRSSSSSRYSSRSKKSKKSRKYRRSRSSERSSKYRRKSRERRSSSRHRKNRHGGKHSRRRSRSVSKHSSNRSPSYSSNRSRSKDKRDSPGNSRGKRRSRSRSPSYSNKSNDKKSPLFDGAELLAKLNKAATEALSENSKKLESLFNDTQEGRNTIINEINAPNFIQKSFCSNDRKEEVPIVTDLRNFVNFSNQMKEEPGSLLHPNLLIENQVDKTNRWIRKLYQIRQKSICGEPLLVD